MQKLPQPLKLSKYDSNAAKTNLELILHECRVKQCFFLNLGYIYSIISLKCGITSSFLYSNKNKLPLLQSTNTLTTYAVSDTHFKETHTHPPIDVPALWAHWAVGNSALNLCAKNYWLSDRSCVINLNNIREIEKQQYVPVRLTDYYLLISFKQPDCSFWIYLQDLGTCALHLFARCSCKCVLIKVWGDLEKFNLAKARWKIVLAFLSSFLHRSLSPF